MCADFSRFGALKKAVGKGIYLVCIPWVLGIVGARTFGRVIRDASVKGKNSRYRERVWEREGKVYIGGDSFGGWQCSIPSLFYPLSTKLHSFLFISLFTSPLFFSLRTNRNFSTLCFFFPPLLIGHPIK